MPRRLHILLRLAYHAAAAFSALLLILLLVLWPRSYWKNQAWTFRPNTHHFRLSVADGRVTLTHMPRSQQAPWYNMVTAHDDKAAGRPWSYFQWGPPPASSGLAPYEKTYLGISWFSSFLQTSLTVPCTIVASLFSLVPAAWAWRRAHQRAQSARPGFPVIPQNPP